MVLYPGLLPTDVLDRVRGLVLTGGAYQFSPSLRLDAVDRYYGTGPEAAEKAPRMLLENASDELLARLPEVFMLMSEREPEAIAQGNEIFHRILSKRLGKDVKLSVMKGHNHVSPHLALMTGQGDEWGYEVAGWVREQFASK